MNVFNGGEHSEVPLLAGSVPVPHQMNDTVTVTDDIKLLKGSSIKGNGTDQMTFIIVQYLELVVDFGLLFTNLFQQSLDKSKIWMEYPRANICPLFIG